MLSDGQQYRKVLLYDASGSIISSLDNINTQMIENGILGAIYVGEAAPGTATDAAGWRIKKISYDASNMVESITWASGVNTFTKVWDDRADYVYS